MTTLGSSYFDGSSSFMQVIRTTIQAWINLHFGQILSPNTKVAALERRKIV